MKRQLRRGAKWLGIFTLIALGLTLADAWQGLGHRATGERRARMERSPQWKNGAFENPEPIVNYVGPMISGAFSVSPDAEPHEPVDARPVDPALLATSPESGLRLTWFGHSSTLIEIDGYRVLTDPVWGERVSPLSWVGPQALVRAADQARPAPAASTRCSSRTITTITSTTAPSSP